MLAWPRPDGPWAGCLEAVESTFLAVAAAISRFEPLLVVCGDAGERERVRRLWSRAGVDAGRARWATAPLNDVWCRDHGPLTVLCGGVPRLLDFRFNGWGRKYPAELDDAVNGRLKEAGPFADLLLVAVDFVLEGGAIETDGEGSFLLHRPCLVDRARNPGGDQRRVEALLAKHLGAQRFLWLDGCTLAGDDTDGHIDTLARFCDPRTILFQGSGGPGDVNHRALTRLERQLGGLTDAAGAPYRLVRLPAPGPVNDRQGRPLPASYANFLLVNGGVLVPAYGGLADGEAAATLAACFPGRRVVPVPCGPLIGQAGSLHCLAMHFPEGVL